MSDPYVPTVPRHPDPPTVSPGGGAIETGSGPPTGTASNGDFYVNIVTGDVYVYVNAAWQFYVSGAGGSNSNATNTDPVGNGSKTGDLWINNTNNNMWFWTGAAWQQIIGA